MSGLDDIVQFIYLFTAHLLNASLFQALLHVRVVRRVEIQSDGCLACKMCYLSLHQKSLGVHK